MARITEDSFRKVTKERNTIHDPVDASWSVFSRNGKTYFQIDTYGRSDRQYAGKISQSLQFDRQSALALVRLLQDQFDADPHPGTINDEY